MNKNSLEAANNLITYFIKLVVNKTQMKPIINRGKMKFALAEILEDWKAEEVKNFIEYYIKTDSQPDLVDFCKRYDEIIRDKKIEEQDSKIRKELMQQTQASVMRFREQYKGAK